MDSGPPAGRSVGVAGEPPIEHIRNALALLVTRHYKPGATVTMSREDYDAMIARLWVAVRLLEGGR